jgi:hypothetical protein
LAPFKGTAANSPGEWRSPADDVREVILAQTGNFLGSDIEKIVKEKYPTKVLSATKVSTVLFRLKERGFLRVVAERSGKTGATFAKA